MVAIPSFDRFFHPVVLLRVNGEAADDLVMRMLEIRIHEDEKRATEVTIQFESFEPNPGFRDSLFDDDRLQPGAQWEIRWGWFDDLSNVLAVRVVIPEPEFSEDGAGRFKLTLHSKQAQMSRDRRSKNWGRTNSSDIARQIGEQYGLSLEVEDSGDRRSRAFLQPANVSDIEFLQRLAQRIGFVCYVESNVLHYHRPNTEGAPGLQLVWMGGDPHSVVKSVKPTLREADARRSRAAGAGADAESEDGGNEQAHMGEVIADLGDVRFTTTEAANPKAVSKATADTDPKALRRRAETEQRKILERCREMRVATIGLPRLRRNEVVNISGVPLALTGNWRIKESTHTIGQNGYHTDITVTRAADRGRGNGRARPNNQEPQEEQGAPAFVVVDTGTVQYVEDRTPR